MRIQFAKHRDDKVTFTCVRDDNSATGMPTGPFFIEHDLIHYAVETVLGFDEAFFGLLLKGRSIESFGAVDAATGRKPREPAQAFHAEQLVGLVQLVRRGALDPDDLAHALTMTVQTDEESLPSITSFELNAVLAKADALVAAWRQLPEGETLELPFPA